MNLERLLNYVVGVGCLMMALLFPFALPLSSKNYTAGFYISFAVVECLLVIGGVVFIAKNKR